MGWRENLFVFLNQRLARLLIPEQYHAAIAAHQQAEEADDDEDEDAEQAEIEPPIEGPHRFGQLVIREHWRLKSDGVHEYIGTPPAGGLD